MRSRTYLLVAGGLLPAFLYAAPVPAPFVDALNGPPYVPAFRGAGIAPPSWKIFPFRKNDDGTVVYSDQLPSAALLRLEELDRQQAWSRECRARQGSVAGVVNVMGEAAPFMLCELRCAVTLRRVSDPTIRGPIQRFERVYTGDLCA